jgi:hypothetical protein
VTGNVLSIGAISSGSPDSPSTTREALMASAKTWSLLGNARSLADYESFAGTKLLLDRGP